MKQESEFCHLPTIHVCNSAVVLHPCWISESKFHFRTITFDPIRMIKLSVKVCSIIISLKKIFQLTIFWKTLFIQIPRLSVKPYTKCFAWFGLVYWISHGDLCRLKRKLCPFLCRVKFQRRLLLSPILLSHKTELVFVYNTRGQGKFPSNI